MTDTHAHLNFNTFKDDAEKIIKDCLDRNIQIINVGSQYDTSARAVKIAEKYEKGVYAAIGIHPIHLSKTEVDEEEMHFKSREEKFDKERYMELLQKTSYLVPPLQKGARGILSNNNKVVAIGEIGLDYFHIPDNMDFEEIKKIQKQWFIEQLKFAKEVNLPVILHCRGTKDKPYEAYYEMLKILEETYLPLYQRGIKGDFSMEEIKNTEKQNNRSIMYGKIHHNLPLGKWGIRGVIHCFGANLEIAEHFLELGFYIGFTGIITFKNASPELLEVVRKMPLDRILVETDCPYLAPEPYRGKQCIPQYVEYTLRKVAELKGISFEEAERETDKNARELFGI